MTSNIGANTLALSDNNPNNTVSWFTNGQNNINFADPGYCAGLITVRLCQKMSSFLTKKGGFTQISGLDLNFICGICHPRVKAQPIVCESFCLRQFENFKIGRKKATKILNSVREREHREEAVSQGLMQFSWPHNRSGKMHTTTKCDNGSYQNSQRPPGWKQDGIKSLWIGLSRVAMITGFILIIIHKSLAPPRPKLIAASLEMEAPFFRTLVMGRFRGNSEGFGPILILID